MSNIEHSLRLVILLTGLAFVASDALGQGSENNANVRAYPVIQGGKWGCMDRRGKVIVQPKYDYVGVCWEKRLSFNIGGSTREDEDGWIRFSGGRWGFLSHTGRVVVPATYLEVHAYREGYATVQTDEGWGVIDMDGKMVVRPRFLDAKRFQEGLCPVQDTSKKYGFINEAGDLVIPAKYEEVGGFCCGLAPVRIGDRWGYVNKAGELVVESTLWRAAEFTEDGLARVRIGRSARSARDVFIDRQGDVSIRPYSRGVGHFSEGLAKVRCEMGIGFMDTSGSIVIPGKYAQCGAFSEGLAAVCIIHGAKPGSRWGFIDKTGEMVIPPRHAYCLPFEGGLSRLVVYTDEGEKEGYIDKQGRWVWPPTR